MDPSIVLPPRVPVTEERMLATMTDLERNLHDAINNRGRSYDFITSFSVIFEADDTKADQDVKSFQSILKMLKISPAREIVVQKDEAFPAWEFQAIVRDLQKATAGIIGQSLIIGHYAGHGGIEDNNLFLAADPSSLKRVFFERVWGDFWLSRSIFERTDVLLILDCCYSGAALRDINEHDRSVEIVAAVGADQRALGNNSTLARLQNKTFTSRVADEIAKRLGRADTTSLTLREIVEAMRSTSNKDRLPQYRLQLGTIAIRLPARAPFSQIGVPQANARSRPSSSVSESFSEPSTTLRPLPQLRSRIEYSAIFSVHIDSVDVEDGEHRSLVHWVSTLDPLLGLELLGVYRSRSTVIVFHSPWRIWAVLAGRPGYQLVCETFGRNRLADLLPLSLPASSGLSVRSGNASLRSNVVSPSAEDGKGKPSADPW